MTIRNKSKAKSFLESLMNEVFTLGGLLEAIRVGDEISQVQMADKLGISRSNLCDIEKGRRIVSPKKAADFARILGYSVNQFVRLALQDQLRGQGFDKLKVEIVAA